uniref:G-protein coupled receptors family 1 profile domain-containing protein n=1 Tax=Ditylenchus dipsaci TaxID=166011 RepID=A0A915DPM5_9BILA
MDSHHWSILNLITIYVLSLYSPSNRKRQLTAKTSYSDSSYGRNSDSSNSMSPTSGRKYSKSPLLSIAPKIKSDIISSPNHKGRSASVSLMTSPVAQLQIQAFNQHKKSLKCTRHEKLSVDTVTIIEEEDEDEPKKHHNLSNNRLFSMDLEALKAESKRPFSLSLYKHAKPDASPRKTGVTKMFSMASSSNNTPTSRTRVYSFLVWLAISDSFSLLTALLMYSVPAIVRVRMESYYLMVMRLSYLFGNALLIVSVWLLFALIFDRYLTLSRSFTVSNSKTSMSIHRIVLAVYVLAICISLPRFFEVSVAFNETTRNYYFNKSDLVHNNLYMVGYRVFGGIIFSSLVPFLLLFTFLSKVWTIMHKANLLASSRIVLRPATDKIAKISGEYCPMRKWVRRRLHSDETTDSEIILGLFTAKLLFSRLMPSLLDVLETLITFGDFNMIMPSTLRTLVSSSNLIVVASSAINFFIFYIFSSTFRRCLHKKFFSTKPIVYY